MVRKTLLCLLFSALILGVSLPAFAGSIDTTDQINLGASPSRSIAFTPNGAGGFFITFTNVFGRASGTGSLSSVQNDFYSIGQNGAVISSNGVGCGGACILLNQTAPLSFSLGTAKGGSNLLTGLLELVDIQQNGSTGTTNNELVVDLTITGGSLASKFNGSNGIVQLTLLLGSGTLLGLKSTLFAMIHGGTVNPLLSEPGTLSMAGLGLLSLAGVIRRSISGALARSN